MLRADDVSYVHGPRSHAPTGDLRDGWPGIRSVSLSVERGAIVGILGPNGSGKTTLLRVLSGLLRPGSGTVSLEGAALGTYSRRQLARRIAVVPQETHLAFDYSVLEIALMGRYPHLGAFELEGPGDVSIAEEALAATGTGHLAGRSFSTLSGGEKQRVVIASALAQEADILLLDEPTASLDLGFQLDIASLLRQLNRDRGLTLVVATHDLNFAASLCHRLLLVRDGGLLASGPTADVLTIPAIADLYGVRADVRFHEPAGHLTVVPLGRVSRPDGTPS